MFSYLQVFTSAGFFLAVVDYYKLLLHKEHLMILFFIYFELPQKMIQVLNCQYPQHALFIYHNVPKKPYYYITTFRNFGTLITVKN